MKNIFLTLSIVCITIFGVKAQTKINCDKIQSENLSLKNKIAALQQDTSFLRDKLAYYDKLNSNVNYSLSSFSSQFDIKVLSCRGDRGAQTVTIEFVIHHKKVNQSVYIDEGVAYDEIGNTFGIKEMSISGKHPILGPVIPTDIDVKGSIIFKGILGGTDKLKLITMKMRSNDADGGNTSISGNLDIRNLKINW